MESFFQSAETIAWVERNGYKRVALQLPDALLHLSFTLSQLFDAHAASFQTFVCADSNYGDCCIDQTTAMHNNADCVVHYGLSCLSRPTTLPAFLVFCDLDARDRFAANPSSELLLEPLREFKSVYVEFDVRYDALARPCFIHQPHVVCAPAPPRELAPSCVSGLQVEEPLVDYSLYDAVVFVGPSECAQLDRLALAACATSQVFSFDFTGLTSLQANRALARRFVLVERVKDAEIVGILVGTMSVAGYADVIAQTKLTIERAGKKTYVFVFGKLSTAKLANFPHVDAFVLVACPFHSLVSKSFEFNKPIVTPYELQVALADRPWGTYLWDFSQLLAKFDVVDQGEEEEVRFSLHTSRIVPMVRQPEAGKKTTLSLRYESPAAQSLQRAAFQGLDPHDSRSKPPAKAVPGQVGVASRVFQLTDTHKQRPH